MRMIVERVYRMEYATKRLGEAKYRWTRQQEEWDSGRRVISGFSTILGCCATKDVELWGLLYGLRMAWETGERRIRVDCGGRFSNNC